jgi:pimeloyl-ACP methyl ester carboxylesterase
MTTLSAPLPSAAGLSYDRLGTGPTLVLLHGVGESTVGWRPVVSRLAHRHDVIAVDLPGFGGSPPLPPGVPPTAAALADAVERALTALHVDQFHVAGYSLGARVALELASQGRALSVIAIASDGLGTRLSGCTRPLHWPPAGNSPGDSHRGPGASWRQGPAGG